MIPENLILINSESLGESSFYSNGNYLIIISPPPFGDDFGYGKNTTVCRSFSLENGKFISTFPIPSLSQIDVCYDRVNNLIWMYTSYQFEVHVFCNYGLAPKNKDSDIYSYLEKLLLCSTSIDICQVLLEITASVATEAMPSQREQLLRKPDFKFSKTDLFEPFCVQVDTELFELLFRLLDYANKKIEKEEEKKKFIHVLI